MATAPIPHVARHFFLRRVLLSILALLLLLYLADFAWYEFRLHFPQLGPGNGSVHRIRLLAVPEKNNKVDFEIDSNKPEEDLACTHSLFPHGGSRPCWYVTRHANNPIFM